MPNEKELDRIKRFKTAERERWLWEIAKTASLEWLQLQSRYVHNSYYLFYRTGEIKVDTVAGIAEIKGGWTLAHGQRIGISQTREAVMHWIYNVLRSTPFLPT